MYKAKPGKRKKRSEIKFLLLLIMIRREGPIGRYRLKEMLDLSDREGLVRLMLSDLNRAGYTRTGKSGSELTEQGKTLVGNFFQKYEILNIKEMDLKACGIGPKSFIIHLHNHKIPEPVVELRDAAVKAGASGAILITYENGTLTVPSVYLNLTSKHPELAEKILKNFNLSEEDTIIIGFSKNKWRALEGCLAITMFLSN